MEAHLHHLTHPVYPTWSALRLCRHWQVYRGAQSVAVSRAAKDVPQRSGVGL